MANMATPAGDAKPESFESATDTELGLAQSTSVAVDGSPKANRAAAMSEYPAARNIVAVSAFSGLGPT